MFGEIKKRVYKANLELKENNLITLTWGNVSAISEDRKYVVIKPSGVDYGIMKPEHMVVSVQDQK